ncbi:hypothetical protein IB276_10680 [Ensifer sp. ENS04]|uniref:hypothetical protein n=1 Tax=Ensifer sp. ENS04 TaxID=2769281 RepID=UPI0017874795|nr:hypothetical protein [Ensifer sp. ENS04]MBD9539919.1 hypothetical protein [Ensifer sp. ENS04]
MSDKQLIECLLGARETSIGGDTYRFERDRHGRFVSDVQSLVHRACLLSVVHYREVPEHPEDRTLVLGVPSTITGSSTNSVDPERFSHLLNDGPTVEEYVAAGYQAVNYPPSGYASRSTPEDIQAAIAAQAAAAADTATDAETTGTDAETADADGANGDTEGANSDTGTANADSAGEAATDTQQRSKRQR